MAIKNKFRYDPDYAIPPGETVVESLESLGMTQAELAISAGGGTCYELAIMQVPMFLIAMARNHEKTVEAYGRARAALAAGWFEALGRESLAASLQGLIGDPKLRKELAENARRMVDGRGAQRVVEAMCSMHREDRVTT